MEHNVGQYLHSTTLDNNISATVNNTTATINSTTSKSATANSEALK